VAGPDSGDGGGFERPRMEHQGMDHLLSEILLATLRHRRNYASVKILNLALSPHLIR
jgi:hypothetical protein